MPIYDLIVIGAGSGGIATARRAASYGAKVLVIENKRVGGTCVNLGCVPKKIMWCAANVRETLHLAGLYGSQNTSDQKFDWPLVKQKRDEYIKRLNGIYEGNLERDKIDLIRGSALLGDGMTVTVDEKTFQGHRILIATGSGPVLSRDTPGHELGITSDDFFALEKQPMDIAIVGSGYIAVELAGIFRALGSDKVSIWCRQDRVLTHFDKDVASRLQEEMERTGIVIHKTSCVRQITNTPDGKLSVHYSECLELADGTLSKTSVTKQSTGHDCVLWAIGRAPVDTINWRQIGIQSVAGHIRVNEWQECSIPGYYAVGDVTGEHMLTPVAIAAGRKLADRLFGTDKDAKMDYENIPSVVFSHPPIATIGLTEAEAVQKFGFENIKIYKKEFSNMRYAILPVEERPSPSLYKLIVTGQDEKIIGLHLIGLGSDEILQGFAVAIKMGACKADFDRTVAIHPTASEDVVSMR